MIVSTLTAKAQTTVPKPIRRVLDLHPGDGISYEIVEGRVTLAKVSSPALSDDPFRTFEEWRSEADTKGYADL